jgi:hypothetical protein
VGRSFVFSFRPPTEVAFIEQHFFLAGSYENNYQPRKSKICGVIFAFLKNMKSFSYPTSFLCAVALAGLSSATQAAIIGVPQSSATITFNDTGSTNFTTGLAGGNYQVGPQIVPGLPAFLFLNAVDPNTGDTASTAIGYSFTPGSYFVGLDGTSNLSHQLGNTGSATLTVNFSVTFQLDAGGLPAGPTFAGYRVYGNVIDDPGEVKIGRPFSAGFASFNATLNYTSLALGPVDALSLSFASAGPGPFDVILTDAGATPALPANDQLTLSGTVTWVADPATISSEAIPEPTAFALFATGLGAVMIRRRR